ncbi:MAG: Crp/Fnr family transcriptional regulator [Qingshengfaniella sp.]
MNIDCAFRADPAQRCTNCSLRSRAVCRAASPQALRDLARQSRHRTFAEDEIIDDGQQGLTGVVLSGALRLIRVSGDGRQQLVGLVFPGEFVGSPFDRSSSFMLEAASDSTVCVFDRAAFRDILRRNPEVEREAFESLTRHLDWLRLWMAALGGLSIVERLAVLLLILPARLDQQGTSDIVDMPFGRADLSALLGARHETISRITRRMERDGLIEILNPRRFRIRDRDMLIEASTLDPEELAAFTRG